MHMNALTLDLDTLTAALLLEDPGARLLERGPAAARLSLSDVPGSTALLLPVDSLEALATQVREATAAQKKGTVLRIVALDAAQLGAAETLKRDIALLQVRSV